MGQLNEQSIESTQNSKNIWMVVASVILTALIVGGGVFWWQKTIFEQRLAQVNNQLKLIQQKNENLSGQIVKLKTKEKTQTEIQLTPTSDSRILLTPENIEQYNKSYEIACNVEFNYDKPSTTVIYQSQQRGLSVELPYNPNWGNDTYKINPYDEDDNSIRFGPISPFEGCVWTRLESIVFKPPLTAEQTESDLVSNPIIEQTIEKIKLSNGLTGFKYIDEGIGRRYVIEVVGEKYNYKISLWAGSEDSEKEFAVIETIANSIKLIK